MREIIYNRYQKIRQYLSNKIDIIDTIEDYEFKCLCLFSLIERFAQEWSDYPTNKPEEVFCDFILKYQKSYQWLDEYNPVTLYYCFKDNLDDILIIQQLEKNYPYDVTSIKSAIDVDIIIDKLIKNGIEQNKINKHQYIHLLYKMRNKLSHEGHFSSWSKSISKSHEKLPRFINCGFQPSTEWYFGFPYDFIKNITIECINNFIDDRQKKKLDPFENNTHEREHNLSWISNPRTYIKPTE